MGCAKGDKGNATAKGGAVSSEGRCDPAAGCMAQSSISAVVASPTRVDPAPASRAPRATLRERPSRGAYKAVRPQSPLPFGLRQNSGAHCVALLGIVDQAMTCVVRLVIIPILIATRSAKDLFRGSLLDAKILFPITPRRRQRRRMGRNISFLRYLCAWPGFLVLNDAYFLFLTSSNSASTTSPSTGFSLPAWDPGSAPGWAC